MSTAPLFPTFTTVVTLTGEPPIQVAMNRTRGTVRVVVFGPDGKPRGNGLELSPGRAGALAAALSTAMSTLTREAAR